MANYRNLECPDEDHIMSEKPNLLEDEEIKRLVENLHKNKVKPNFGCTTPARPLHLHQGVSNNPFAVLAKDNPEEAKVNLEEMEAGWSFQGKKKHIPTISPRPAQPQSPLPTPNIEVTPRGRRKRAHSDVHCSYFSSLGILTPPGQDHARAKVWPVLARDKSDQKELLFFAKNNALPGLPLSI